MHINDHSDKDAMEHTTLSQVSEDSISINEEIVNDSKTLNIKCGNYKNEFTLDKIQGHIKEKHAIRWVRDSILCLNEGIVKLSDKYEEYETRSKVLPNT